jgi:hypothetical protein
VGESVSAAQALQGPLDGTWTLEDSRRQPLFVLQITDPAGGAGPLGGAWLGSAANARANPIDAITRRGDRLSIEFADNGKRVRISLKRDLEGRWSGVAKENGRDLLLTLRRSAPDPAPR